MNQDHSAINDSLPRRSVSSNAGQSSRNPSPEAYSSALCDDIHTSNVPADDVHSSSPSKISSTLSSCGHGDKAGQAQVLEGQSNYDRTPMIKLTS